MNLMDNAQMDQRQYQYPAAEGKLKMYREDLIWHPRYSGSNQIWQSVRCPGCVKTLNTVEAKICTSLCAVQAAHRCLGGEIS